MAQKKARLRSIELMLKEKYQNAQLDKITNCGYLICPNQFCYLNRPETLGVIFNNELDIDQTRSHSIYSAYFDSPLDTPYIMPFVKIGFHYSGLMSPMLC